jgi:hypothetical protein
MRTILLFIIGCSLIQAAIAQNIITITNGRTVFLPKDYMEGVPEYYVPEGVTVTLSAPNSDLTYYMNRSQFYNNTNVLQITNWTQWTPDAQNNLVSDFSGDLSHYNKYPPTVAGPVYLKVLSGSAYSSTNSYWKASFTITCQMQAPVTIQTNSSILNPNSSVVIPSNVSGDVEVVLEQSQDGVTWTQCLPGTYNASTVKRFFRLRAVEK